MKIIFWLMVNNTVLLDWLIIDWLIKIIFIDDSYIHFFYKQICMCFIAFIPVSVRILLYQVFSIFDSVNSSYSPNSVLRFLSFSFCLSAWQRVVLHVFPLPCAFDICPKNKTVEFYNEWPKKVFLLYHNFPLQYSTKNLQKWKKQNKNDTCVDNFTHYEHEGEVIGKKKQLSSAGLRFEKCTSRYLFSINKFKKIDNRCQLLICRFSLMIAYSKLRTTVKLKILV